MSNPFEIIDKRLSNIEGLLLSIKHPEPVQTYQQDSTEKEFSISELAVYLKCSKATIHAYKKRGIFTYYQTGRKIFFKKSEVDKALVVNKQKRG